VSARASYERDAVAIACAISAGIHAALAGDHAAFAPAAVLLGAVTVAMLRGGGRRTTAAAAGLLALLIGAWVLAVTTGVPLLHPDPEEVEGIALFTKTVELLGLAAALDLLTRPLPKGVLA
jgi:hypothetical protein